MYFIHVYIYILNPKKKNKDSQIFQKKKKKIKWESVWTRGIGPLSHLKIKIKKIFELGPLNFLVTFSKKTQFFSRF